MIRHLIPLAAAALLACAPGCSQSGPSASAWQPMPEIAPGTPYGLGVSALYAGQVGDALLAAGGANFPETPAAEGGAKRFYDAVWLLPDGADAWQAAGRLPVPSAYGAAYAAGGGLVVAGGANAAGTLDAVWLLTHAGDSVSVRSLPPLPAPVEQAAAASDGRWLYLAGGLSNGEPVTEVYRCDTTTFVWQAVARLPEPLVQPVACARAGRLYVWGGYNPVERSAVACGYRYDPAAGWETIAGVPDGGTLTGAASVTTAEGQLVVAGGVDRAVFTAALRMAPEEGPAYLAQEPEAYRFRQQLLRFDPADERWTELGRSAAAARAGAVLAATPRGIVLLNGELKPGIRSPQIVRMQPNR